MEKVLKGSRKYLTIGSIAGLGIMLLMLILTIFIESFALFKNDFRTGILLTLLVLTVGFFFFDSAIGIFGEKKKIAIITMCLLLVSAVLLLIWIWYVNGVGVGGEKRKPSEIYLRITGIIAITTVLFTIIVTSTTKLHKRFLPLQIITFGLVTAIDICLVIQILGFDIISKISTIFIIACIVTFGLLSTISILSKRVADSVDDEFVKIKKSEYLALVEKAKLYDEEHPQEEKAANE